MEVQVFESKPCKTDNLKCFYHKNESMPETMNSQVLAGRYSETS